MKKPPHVIWVCPSSRPFFRSKGEVRCRPGSVLPKLVEQGIKVNVLIPHDPTLLPKTKLSAGRTTTHNIQLDKQHPVQITKLTRGAISPGIYMASVPHVDPAVGNALFSKAALALALQLKRPVDIFHLFEWEVSLLPLFLELDKNKTRLFKNTRTFLNLTSLREQGNFSPTILDSIGVPKTLFHPDGVEFYGRVSFLKAGLLFADVVGLVDGVSVRNHSQRNGQGFEGLLELHAGKVRRWASSRSLRAHVDAYRELLSLETPRPSLPHVMGKVHTDEDQLKRFIESWGPLPADRYEVNAISFMAQSPTKAYGFWEWNRHDYRDYGLSVEDTNAGTKKFLSRGLNALGDYWFEVQPGHAYVIELLGYGANGVAKPLLRSRVLRVPRNSPSPNTQATFIDVKNKRRFVKEGGGILGAEKAGRAQGSSHALDWASLEMPSSFRETVSSS